MITDHYSTYRSYSREEWASLYTSSPFQLTPLERMRLQGKIENLTNEEISEFYLPLIQYITLNIKATEHLHKVRNEFLKISSNKRPFIIGVAGSVAVGKSTTSRILQYLLSNLTENLTVDLVTTDGFLFSNEVLKAKGLSEKKGFPESYDLKGLIEFLTEVKSGSSCAKAPVYSHLHYDIIPDQYNQVCQPDIVIIEGINVLQTPKQIGENVPSKFVSDFFDLSIYVDAAENDILKWYIDRFKVLKATAFANPESYFHRYATLSDLDAESIATDIWNRINKVNLEQNILPTKFRADLIIEKSFNHQVETIRIRNL